MKQLDYREVEHQVTVSAPAATVYRLIAEVENWPLIFPPTVYVDHVERSGTASGSGSGPPPTARPRTGPLPACSTPRDYASISVRRSPPRR